MDGISAVSDSLFPVTVLLLVYAGRKMFERELAEQFEVQSRLILVPGEELLVK